VYLPLRVTSRARSSILYRIARTLDLRQGGE